MASKNKRRKKRYRVHKGRIIVVLLVLIALVIGGIFAIKHLSKAGYSSESGFRKFSGSLMEVGKQEVGKTEHETTYGEPLSVAYTLPVTDFEKSDAKIREKWEADSKKFTMEHQDDPTTDQAAIILGTESYETPYDLVSFVTHTYRYTNNDEAQILSDDVNVYLVSTVNGLNMAPAMAFNGDWESIFNEEVSAYLEANYEKTLRPDYKDLMQASKTKFALTNEGLTWYFNSGSVADASEGAIAVSVPYEKFDGVLRDDIGKRVIDPSLPMVAITYDDGPGPGTTSRILDVYEKYGVVCTFFELGQNVDNIEGASDLLKRELSLGCEIGTHSYSHPDLYTLSEESIKNEADKSISAIEKATGQKPTVFRAPYGNGNDNISKIFGLPGFNWSVDTLDWSSRNADSVVSIIKGSGDMDGGIILMHSIYDSTAEATEEIVPWLIDQGYQLVTISELMEYKYGHETLKDKYYGYFFYE